MTATLHLLLTAGMLFFTGTGLCCALVGGAPVGGRRGRDLRGRDLGSSGWVGAAWMALMLVAMADVAARPLDLLSHAGWALVLLLAGPLSVLLARREPVRLIHDPLGAGMHLHRGISLLVMGVLVLFAHPGQAVSAQAAVHAHGGAANQAVFLAAALGAYLLYTARICLQLHRVRASRSGSRAHLLEALSSVAAAVCMAVMAMPGH